MADDGATEVAIDSHESESESEGEPMYESVLTDERHARGWTPQLIAMDEKERLEGEDSFRQTVRLTCWLYIGKQRGSRRFLFVLAFTN